VTVKIKLVPSFSDTSSMVIFCPYPKTPNIKKNPDKNRFFELKVHLNNFERFTKKFLSIYNPK